VVFTGKRLIASFPMLAIALKSIPCSFLHYAPFGGAFHCATLDVRRSGGVEDCFN
jgi:hypothetical protein